MDLAEIVVAVIAGGLITQLVGMYRAKAEVRTADRKQHADEQTGAATAAKNITDAAASIVKLQDDQVEELKRQVDEFKLQLRAAQAELSAFNTRLDREMQDRLRAEARASVNESRIDELTKQLASMGAQFEMADQERTRLRNENGAMKTKLFEWSVGIASLTRQVEETGMQPVFVLDIPVSATGRLGPLDADVIRSIQDAGH